MTKVQIPSTIKEATSTLAGLDDLITAKEWHRAAIVYAFTYDAQGRRNLAGKPAKFSVTDFAKRGIVGLRDRNTIAAYRANWQWAIDQGAAEDVKPGDRVELPDLEWPGRTDTEGQKRYTAKDPNSFAKILNRGDLDIDVFAQNLSKETREALVARIAEDAPGVIAKAVEGAPGAARAIARNEAAMESVEEYGIEHRARHQPDHQPADPGKLSRTVGNNVNKALGGGDMATEELHGAARQIMQAMVWAEEHGIEDEEAEAKAIARIKKNLRIYEQKADVTDTDREWAASQGIKL